MREYRVLLLFFLILTVIYLTGCRKIDTVISDTMFQSGGEYWELLTIKGKTVGFQRTVLSFEEIKGESIRRFERQSRMIVLRYGNSFNVAMKVNSISKLDGVFLSGTVQLYGGGEPIETTYRSENDQLIVSNSSGQTILSWKQSMSGPETILCELLNAPMQFGEERQVTFFEPAMHSYVNATLKACNTEQVDVHGVTKNLLRIEVQNRLELLGAGVQTVSETLWADAGGNIITRKIPIEEQTLLAVRVSREKALKFQMETPSVELGNLGVVPLNDSITQPHNRTKIEFIVETQEGLPTNRFPQTPFQSVELIDEKRAKITVLTAINNNNNNNNNNVNDNTIFKRNNSETKTEDLASNQLIDLNDPQLIELANRVHSDSLTSWQTALALERLVHDTIQETSFSIALATSSEILRSKSGDCTEFAVLLAALCRAKKLPARITLGLVYTPFRPINKVPQHAGMVFHLWNEVFIDGIWYPLDAVFALGGADAARIKITDTSLADNSLAPLSHSLIGVIGRIQIHLKKSESPP
ncbi:MAG: transglutaminase family protein [Planctomycetaceae bacterium]|jgi:transglutaminase-like putative cysteine protease|nr:transglutaminase family protein [Planctomycetaceae bacterium]